MNSPTNREVADGSDDLEAKLNAMTKNAFEVGAMAMQNTIAKLLLANDMPITAESVMSVPLPTYFPPPKGPAQ